MNNNDRIDSKPRTLKELAQYYNVDRATFKKWLQCQTLAHVRPEVGRYYSIKQVKEIINHLGSNE